MSLQDDFYKIKLVIEKRYHFICPVCDKEYESEQDESKDDFVKSIMKEGVRFKSMEMMEGVFCEECHTDPEIQSSTL